MCILNIPSEFTMLFGRDSIELDVLDNKLEFRSFLQLKAIVVTFALVVFALTLGCSTRSTDSDLDLSTLVLHIDYRNGGDAPLGFLMSFFEDGRVRFLSPRWKILWSELSTEEHRSLQEMLRSPSFQKSLEFQAERGPRFACCDTKEVGIFLGLHAQPISVAFSSSAETAEPLLELVKFVNRTGSKHFGRRFSIPLPEDGLGPRSR